MTLRIVAIVACVLIAILPVTAAEPARDLASMQVAPDAVIYVRTSNGAEIQGRFLRASTQALVVGTTDGREIILPSAQVLFVWKRGDSLRNGAIIGGVVGLAGAIFGQSECTKCSGEIAIGVALGVPAWVGVGALVDRLRVGRTLIYRAP